MSLIVYLSLVPFDLSGDPSVLLHRLDQAWRDPLAIGRDGFSWVDWLINVSAFLPLGGSFRLHGFSAGAAALLGTGLAAVTETLQLAVLSRTASALDVLANGMGALAGALTAPLALRAGMVLLRRGWLSGALAVVAMLAALAWRELAWHERPAWGDVPVWGGLGSALVAWMLRNSQVGGLRCDVLAFASTVGMAVLLDGGRSGLRGGVSAHLSAGVLGAVLGICASRVGSAELGARQALFLAIIGLVFVCHLELSPYDFDRSALGAKRSDWPPFTAYFYAHPRDVLLDAWPKLGSSGLLGLAASAWWTPRRHRRRAATPARSGPSTVPASALALALALEASQYLLASRIPSLGDVLLLTAGAAAGGWLWLHFGESAVQR